jgi:hypothetical protein
MKSIRSLNSSAWFLAAAFGLSACQDPFPPDRDFSPQKPAAKEPPLAMPYSIEVPGVMQFKEGETGEFEIKARVPAPGTPVVEVIGLPEGAAFSRSHLTLSWTPGYDAGNDPEDESSLFKRYTAKVRVSSSETPDAVLEEPIVLWVIDSLRPIQIDIPSQVEVKEGEVYSRKIKITSPDFPRGPFTISGKPLPEGLRVDEVEGDPTAFVMHYAPGFRTVQNTHSVDNQGYFRDLEFTFRVGLVRGKSPERQVKWRVRDQRQTPKISGPLEITETNDVTFNLSSEDLNGEQDPVITLVQRPSFGQVKVQSLMGPSKLNQPKLAGVSVRWHDIPPSQYGKEGTFVFKACVAPLLNGVPLCGTHTTKVTLSGELHLPPEIDRKHWPLGKVMEVEVGKSLHIPMEVIDGETGVSVDEVQIEAPQSADEVSWANGILTLTGKTPGLKQFNLKAYSEYGVGRTESMVYQVTPAPEGGGE